MISTVEPATRALAIEMVRLDVQIRHASRARRWLDAHDLEQAREVILHTRMELLRHEWQERRIEQ